MKAIPKLILVLFCFISSSISAQKLFQIKGIVKDTVGSPIPLLSVVLLENKSIVDYTYTSQEGEFTISSSKKTGTQLIISGMGYLKQEIQMDSIFLEDKNSASLFIHLKSKPFQLNEVSVNGKVPVVKKNDTISYLAEAYLNGSEKTTEDLLRKIPGIQVSEDGIIKAFGKQIEKVMIDGDDLFKKGYRILTKNLDAQFVEKVEILENYFENPLYKNIDTSNRVALNLRLKKNASPIFGSAQIAHSEKDLYFLRNNLISLKKKLKTYLFGNANNTGVDPTGDIYQLINPGVLNSDFGIGDQIRANPLIDLGNFNVPGGFKNKFNEAEFISLNNIYNPFEYWKFKNVSFFTADETDTFKNEFIRYNTLSEFNTFEDSKIRKRYKSLNINLNALKLKGNNRFEYNFKLVDRTNKSNSNLYFNTDEIKESLQGHFSRQDHKASLTNKINNRKIWETTARYIHDKKPLNYQVNYSSAATTMPAENNQYAMQKIEFFGINSKYLYKKKNTINSIDVGYLETKNTRLNRLINRYFSIEDSDKLLGNQHINQSDYYTSLTNKYLLNHWTIKTNIRLQKSFYRLDSEIQYSKYNPLTLSSNLGGIYNWRNKNMLTAFYSFSDNTLDTNFLSTSYLQTGFRNYRLGLDRFTQLKSHQFLLSYEYGDLSSPFHLNSSIVYQFNPTYTSNKLYIGTNFNYTVPELFNNQEIVILNIESDYFIKPLHGILKFNLRFSKFNLDNIINDLQLTSATKSTNFKAQYRSTFEGVFNFHLGINKYTNRFSNRSINNKSGFLDIDLFIRPNFLMAFQNEVFKYSNDTHSYAFSNLKFIYNPKNKNYSSTISFNNLLDEDRYVKQFINEYSTITTTYKLFPRNIMINFSFNF